MFGFGIPELMIIMVIALIVVGPNKLPELARSLGKGLAEFKKASNDFRRNVEEEGRGTDVKERTGAEASGKGPVEPEKADGAGSRNACA